jgi:GNAT superfamily N-acetyltransferase
VSLAVDGAARIDTRLVGEPVDLRVTNEPSRDDVQFLEERLYEFNASRTGIDDGQLLGIFARDAAGRIVGGLYGWTWGGCCEIKLLWVDEAWRGKRLGSRLLERAEKEARARGAAQIVLDTHGFQAPAFYERLGFEAVGAVADCPVGHEKIYMRKRLDRSAPAPPAPGCLDTTKRRC